MDEDFNKRGSKIYESATEQVCARIKELAESGTIKFKVEYRDGAPEGTLQFYLLHEDFAFADKETHLAFMERIFITDTVLNANNTRLIEEPNCDPYIEAEPRQDW